jgi:hypothetical protein
VSRVRAGLLSAAGLAVLLVATGFVAATAPREADWEQPFAIDAPLGEPAQGRNIAATVHDAAIAERVVDRRWRSGEGSTWVVVDASAAAVTSEIGALLGHAALVVGDRVYLASTRPSGLTLNGASLSIGVPTRGALLFELPADVLGDPAAAAARLELAVKADPRLDAMLLTPIDLTALPVLPEYVLDDAEWGER